MKEFKIEDIASAVNNDSQSSIRFVIPVFQRGKRWDFEKNKKFIDSLINGYPVGSFLLYTQEDCDDPKEFVLVDGLQRSICALNFCKNPETYLSSLVDIDKLLIEIANLLEIDCNNEKTKDFFKNKVIRSGLYQQTKSYEILDELCESIGFNDKIDRKINTQICNLIDDRLKDIRSVTDTVKNTKIPCVIYKGSSDHLNEIFTRINQDGVKLTKYEIYAASWPQKVKYKINDDTIVRYVANKYNSFIQDNLTVQNYNKKDFLEKKELTTFEFLFGFGKKLIKEYSFLEECKSKGNDASDIEDVAFILINACYNTSMSDMEHLYKKLDGIDLNILEARILEALKFVEDSLAPYTLFKSNRRTKEGLFPRKYHAIAMISSCFREMFDLNTLKPLDSWKNEKSIYPIYLRQHFVYETINQDWSEGNQGTLFSVLSQKRYSLPVDKNEWNLAIEKYYLESKNNLDSKKINRKDNPSREDILLLNVIYCHQFSSFQQNDSTVYHIDHIAPKAQLRNKCEMLGQKYLLPVSSFANFCFLTEEMNKEKGNKTIYQSKKFKEKYNISEIEEKYVFTTIDDLKWLNSKHSDIESLKKQYINFIDSRFVKLKKKLCESLEIEYMVLSPTQDQTIPPDVAIDSICRNCEQLLHAKLEIKGEGPRRDRFLVDINDEIGYVVAYSTYHPTGDGRWFYTISENRCKNISKLKNKKVLFIALGNGKSQETRVFCLDWTFIWNYRENSTGGRHANNDSIDLRFYFNEEGNIVWKRTNKYCINLEPYQII